MTQHIINSNAGKCTMLKMVRNGYHKTTKTFKRLTNYYPRVPSFICTYPLHHVWKRSQWLSSVQRRTWRKQLVLETGLYMHCSS